MRHFASGQHPVVDARVIDETAPALRMIDAGMIAVVADGNPVVRVLRHPRRAADQRAVLVELHRPGGRVVADHDVVPGAQGQGLRVADRVGIRQVSGAENKFIR